MPGSLTKSKITMPPTTHMQESSDLLFSLLRLLKLMLDVWIFDRISDSSDNNHRVDNGGEPAGLEVRFVIPPHEIRDRATIHRDTLPQA